MASQFPAFPKLLAVLLCLMSVAGAGCGSSSGDGRPSIDPYSDPEFLTPVAEAQSEGVSPYWLGDEFEADGLTVQISGDVSRAGWGDPIGLSFLYGGWAEDDRHATVFLYTFSREGGGAAAHLETVLAIPGAAEQEARVGSWEGKLVLAPSATRLVNQAYVYVSVGDMDVVVGAQSGSTGVPGTDVNPLLDEDLLIEVVAENLRPYPE